MTPLRDLVLHLLATSPPLTGREVARRLGASHSTVAVVLAELEGAGLYHRPMPPRRPPPPPLSRREAEMSAERLAAVREVSERTARRYLARARRSASPTTAASSTP